MNLWPHQTAALESLAVGLAAGQNRLLWKIPTGGGKTIAFAQVLNWPSLKPWLDSWPKKGAQLLVVAHREELLTQARAKIQAANPGLMISIEQGDSVANRYSDVIIASIQTLAARKFTRLHRLLRYHAPRVVIVDECFPAGTAVGDKSIEDILAGDVVDAFDTATNRMVQRRVVRTMRKIAPDALYRITRSDGAVVVATGNHRFWTPSGWAKADILSRGSMVLSYGNAQSSELHGMRRSGPALVTRRDGLLRSVSRGAARKAAQACISAMRGMREVGRVCRTYWLSLGSVWPRLLFRGAQASVSESCVFGGDGSNESARRLCANEGAESYEAVGYPSKGQRDIESDGTRAIFARRQRASHSSASGRSRCSLGMADGGNRANQDAAIGRVSDPLQDRHCKSSSDDSDRSGRRIARDIRATAAGSPQGQVLAWARVDSIEVFERGSDGRFGGLCPDGYVYNLEVEEVHTYTANGFVVSNCHHSAAASYRTMLAHLGFLPLATASDKVDAEAVTHDDVEVMTKALAGWDQVSPKDRLLLGVTATPNRSDAIGLGCVFNSIAYSYALKQAVEDGWLVPMVPWVVETTSSLDAVRTTAGDFNQKDLAGAVNNFERNRLALESWHTYAEGLPTLGFTVDVRHAHDLADVFNSGGVRSAALSGETPKDERRAMLAAYSSRDITAIFNCMVLSEGTDLPLTQCILNTKPTKSATLYEQMVGRGLRIFPGKDACIIIDMVDVSRRHSLQAAPVLYGLPPGLVTKGKDLRKVSEELDALREKYPSLNIEEMLASGRMTLEQLGAKASTFDVWTVPTLGELGSVVTLDWIRTATDTFRLSYPWQDGSESVSVQPDVLGHFDVSLTLRPANGSLRQRTVASQVPTVIEALQLAEKFITAERQSVMKLKAQDAPWKSRPASIKQIQYLQRMKIPHNPRGLTMGQCSNMIDMHKAKRGH